MVAAQGAIKFNGGGHLNHSIFWTNLCPPSKFTLPTGPLATAIDAQYGSLEEMQKKMSAMTVAVQGSGLSTNTDFLCGLTVSIQVGDGWATIK